MPVKKMLEMKLEEQHAPPHLPGTGIEPIAPIAYGSTMRVALSTRPLEILLDWLFYYVILEAKPQIFFC